MRLLLSCLALAAVLAHGETGVAHAGPIALYADFQCDPPREVVAAIRDELRRIMAPIGLEFDWRSISESQNQVSAGLVVVSFKGACEADGLSPLPLPEAALGWTHVSDGVILPFSDIDCAAIRSFVQLDLLKMQKARRAEAYGRAIGRVLSHEMYHVFAHTQSHGIAGIGKAAYTVQELLSPAFRFDAHESRELRNRESHSTAQLATVPTK